MAFDMTSLQDYILEQFPTPSNSKYLHSIEAIEKGNIKVVIDIIQNGVDINEFFTTGKFYNPLLVAIEENKVEIIKYLIANGANPNVVSCTGKTPLRAAISSGCPQIVEMLIENCADIDTNSD